MNVNSSIPFMDLFKAFSRCYERLYRRGSTADSTRHSNALASGKNTAPGILPIGRLRVSLSSVSICVLLLLLHTATAADFTVTTPGFFYAISGMQPNPTLTLVRGNTYTFSVNAGPTHPFKINSPGVANNNISQGTITYTVPNVASNYSYICSVHGFGAQIITIPPTPPPPPPTIELLSLSVGSNLVLVSTGTNTWSVNPQFSTNLTSTNWYALAVITNRFLSGTNETICGRPPGDSVFVRIQSSPK